ncbi:hypothetical protein C0Q70_10810 [Pomacea canaliculata]|uniref:OTU domain-containing protein n=2 Tax=Pomacea canaliculata TaxID=400727 RepID=A0A2T7P495_POMCA|nr:hypothetical protein C0Q70_10810 [Pomacea canaliculata]
MQKSPQKKSLRKRVENNIDFDQGKRGYPICFKNKESFYLTELPDLSHLPPSLKQQALEGIEDKDMKQDLLAANLINWCSNTRYLLPLTVPRDGNCLLHSVSMAIWGFLDDQFLLRRLLCFVLSTDIDRRFYSRWIRQRQQQISALVNQLLESNTESLTKEWKEIGACLDQVKSAPPAAPHRFLEPIHVYTLANILRRPIIIITDPKVRTFCGLTLQDNDMGGIYLPLEFNWSETCRTPLLLGYAHSHFCPLILAEQTTGLSDSRKNLVPIVTKYEQLPLRFLLEGEEPEVAELLKKYLKVRETVITIDNELREILCAEIQTNTPQNEFNLMKDYFRQWEGQYRLQQQRFTPVAGDTCFSTPHHQGQTGVGLEYQPQQILSRILPPGMPPVAMLPGGLLGSTQAQQMRLEQLQRTPPALSPGIVRLGVGNSGFPLASTSVPLHSPPPPKVGQLEGQNLSSLEGRQCITPNCTFCGDPALGGMCSVCFKDYTIKDSRSNATRLMMAELRQNPSAPLLSGMADEERFEMSMMAERCLGKCGYRCSVKTYPYCHECAEKYRRKAQAKISSEAQASKIISTSQAAAAGTDILPSSSRAQEPIICNKFTSEAVIAEASCAAPNSRSESVLHQSSASAGNINGREAAASVGSLASPTQALASVNLVAPLTPPDEGDQDLFGSGVKSPASSRHPSLVGSPTPATMMDPQPNTAQQAVPFSYDQQQENKNSGSVPTLRNPPNLEIKQTESPAKCIQEGCLEMAVINKLCGRCFVCRDRDERKGEEPASEAQEASISSAPLALGAGSSSPKPGLIQGAELALNLENESHMSSVSNQAHPQTALNYNPAYVREWVAQISLGFPDRHGSELGEQDRHGSELGEQDLVASGLACFSSTFPCTNSQCSNRVTKPNQLCSDCTEILNKARREQDFTQESAAEKAQRIRPSNTVQAPAAHHNTTKSQLRPATALIGRRGKPCSVPNCELFGDPKQNDMCSKHYWSTVGARPQLGRNSSNIRVAGNPYESVHFAMPESMGSACCLQGSISVPPPSFPVAESLASAGNDDFAGLRTTAKFNDAYNRVLQRPEGIPRCNTLGCRNYASKNGLCNSCYSQNSNFEEARRFALLGEDQIG